MSRNKCPACLGPLPKPGARPVASKPWRLSCFCPSAGVTGSRAIPSCARALGIRTQLLTLLQQALFSAASLQPHLGSFLCHLSCYQPPTPGASQTLLLRSWSQHHGHTTLPLSPPRLNISSPPGWLVSVVFFSLPTLSRHFLCTAPTPSMPPHYQQGCSLLWYLRLSTK